MPSVILFMSASEVASLRDRDGKAPALGMKFPIYRWESTDHGLDVLAKGGSLYLVAERAKKLWLVAVLNGVKRDKNGWRARVMNTTPIVDLTSARRPLDLKGNGLRVLNEAEAAAMDRARIDALHAHDHVVELDTASLEEARANASKPKRPRLPKLAGELGDGCLTQIEAAIDDLRKKPNRYLKQPGAFVADVQSIYDGVFTAKEAQALLKKELAPFARNERDVNKVAIRAVDELCRGMVAMALDRKADIPTSCGTLRKPLERYAAYVKSLLAN